MLAKIVQNQVDVTAKKIVVLGTGGTMAGLAKSPEDNLGYTAGQVGVGQLLQGLPGLAQWLHKGLPGGPREVVAEQVAQLDSKDMSFAVWQMLAARVQHHLAQADVQGVVIAHGTDTLEETAFFLHQVLRTELTAAKPVVMTCAMRPASAVVPDGPQNLLDALAVALTPGAHGVTAVCAGRLHSALDIQKVHPYRLDAFDSGDSGPLGYMEEKNLRLVRNWPLAPVEYAYSAIDNVAAGLAVEGTIGVASVAASTPHWPRVEIVMSHAGATGALVDALLLQNAAWGGDSPADPARYPGRDPVRDPVRGLVVAATGNGTLHVDLEAALLRAQAAGIRVVRASRCTQGRVLPLANSRFPDSQGLSPVKARIALMLALRCA